jgi:hypothetical protein
MGLIAAVAPCAVAPVHFGAIVIDEGALITFASVCALCAVLVLAWMERDNPRPPPPPPPAGGAAPLSGIHYRRTDSAFPRTVSPDGRPC